MPSKNKKIVYKAAFISDEDEEDDCSGVYIGFTKLELTKKIPKS